MQFGSPTKSNKKQVKLENRLESASVKTIRCVGGRQDWQTCLLAVAEPKSLLDRSALHRYFQDRGLVI